MQLNLLAFTVSAFLLALPKMATADVIDDITVVGSGYTITFSVPATGVTPDHPHAVYLTDSTVMTINGYSGTGSAQFMSNITVVEPYTVILDLPAIPQLSSLPSVLSLSGPPVDTTVILPTSNPIPVNHPDDLQLTLVPGVYSFQNAFAGIGSNPNVTITITPEATPAAATPEPGTLALLFTGACASCGMVSRRRVS